MSTVEAELAFIEKRDGILQPAAVVAFAKERADSALRQYFQWDDTKAAAQWRLEQARRIIRVRVCTLPPDSGLPSFVQVRAYVSLSSDRRLPGGGYRPLGAVLESEERHAEMLADALREAAIFSRKYAMLRELAPVIQAIDAVSEAVAGVKEEEVQPQG